MVCGEEECRLEKGDWVCSELWLNYIPYAQYWYTVSATEIVVQCQTILHSNMSLLQHSSANELPRMRRKNRLDILALNPLKVPPSEHDFLMDAVSIREGLDYEIELPAGGNVEEGHSSDEDEHYG